MSTRYGLTFFVGNITFWKIGLTLPCFNFSGNFDVFIFVFNYIFGLSFSIVPFLWFFSLYQGRFCITFASIFPMNSIVTTWAMLQDKLKPIFSVVLIFPVVLHQVLQSIKKYWIKRKHELPLIDLTTHSKLVISSENLLSLRMWSF